MVHLLVKGIFVIGACLLLTYNHSQAISKSPLGQDYSHLLDFIEMEDLQGPLIVFADNEGGFDEALNQENLAYLNENKELLKQLKSKLNGATLNWKLSSSSKRLLVVPEKRQEYAQLFERYCHEAINYLLDRIRLPNPYQRIATIEGPLPAIDDQATETEGVTVYIVHNVADEYIEEYIFFNQEDDSTQIKVKLSNRLFSGIIGSYTSKLKIGENNQFEFIRESYTLWQNSAKNPLNVFIAPIEETLHIVLRVFTETAIQENLKKLKPQKLFEVKNVIDDWMAVEEAIVGGLVSFLMPEIFTHIIHLPIADKMAEAMAARDQHVQYRYLNQGIQVVIDLGLHEAINLYKSSPQQFKQMVSQPISAAAS